MFGFFGCLIQMFVLMVLVSFLPRLYYSFSFVDTRCIGSLLLCKSHPKLSGFV